MNTCNKEHLIWALSQARFQEIVGNKDNPEILKYFDIMGFDGSELHDETSWCSAFVNWVCIKANLPYSGELTARSWLNVGHEVDKGHQEIGDVVVFWRESPHSWKGHVGFYLREDKDWIYVLGGNQNDQVKFSAYRKNRLLQYRRLTSY